MRFFSKKAWQKIPRPFFAATIFLRPEKIVSKRGDKRFFSKALFPTWVGSEKRTSQRHTLLTGGEAVAAERADRM